MELRWFGTAAVNVVHADGSILFDPFVSRNPKLRCISAQELAGMGDIFLTHGHFDHAMDVPLIVSLGTSNVYCSSETAQTLAREGVDQNRIKAVQPGDIIEKGPFSIKVLAGEHSQPDTSLLLRTYINIRILTYFRTFLSLLKSHRKFAMGQVLTYQIEAEGKTMLHMGSLNLAQEESYPVGVDLMALPYQGRSDLNEYALPFVELVKPKTLFMHHYDNTFPPVSRQIDCHVFAESIKQMYPELKVIIPEYLKVYSF